MTPHILTTAELQAILARHQVALSRQATEAVFGDGEFQILAHGTDGSQEVVATCGDPQVAEHLATAPADLQSLLETVVALSARLHELADALAPTTRGRWDRIDWRDVVLERDSLLEMVYYGEQPERHIAMLRAFRASGRLEPGWHQTPRPDQPTDLPPAELGYSVDRIDWSGFPL